MSGVLSMMLGGGKSFPALSFNNANAIDFSNGGDGEGGSSGATFGEDGSILYDGYTGATSGISPTSFLNPAVAGSGSSFSISFSGNISSMPLTANILGTQFVSGGSGTIGAVSVSWISLSAGRTISLGNDINGGVVSTTITGTITIRNDVTLETISRSYIHANSR